MTYVISDIHGEYDLFIKLLKKIDFSFNDEMIICGDVIDKGKKSVKLLRFIESMPNFRCIVGNHEYDFLKYYHSILMNSPTDFAEVSKKLQSYFPYDGELFDVNDANWLDSLPYCIIEDDFICVHAGVSLKTDNTLVPLSETSVETLVYDRSFKEPSVVPRCEKCIFYGHTPTSYLSDDSAIIKYARKGITPGTVKDYYKIHLDTGAWLNGVLGCFCVDDCKDYYVSKYDL